MLKVTGVAEESKSSLEIPKKFQRQRVSPLSASAAASVPKDLSNQSVLMIPLAHHH